MMLPRLIFLLLLFFGLPAFSQVTPNIGFDDGTFTNWQCWTGSVITGTPVLNAGYPVPGRHTIIDSQHPQDYLMRMDNSPCIRQTEADIHYYWEMRKAALRQNASVTLFRFRRPASTLSFLTMQLFSKTLTIRLRNNPDLPLGYIM